MSPSTLGPQVLWLGTTRVTMTLRKYILFTIPEQSRAKQALWLLATGRSPHSQQGFIIAFFLNCLKESHALYNLAHTVHNPS